MKYESMSLQDKALYDLQQMCDKYVIDSFKKEERGKRKATHGKRIR